MGDPKYEHIGGFITCTIEECSELIHILCKVQRFGWKNWHPQDKEKTPNYVLVQSEINDVKRRLELLEGLVKEFKAEGEEQRQ